MSTKPSSKHNKPLKTIESNTVRNEIIRTVKINIVKTKEIGRAHV